MNDKTTAFGYTQFHICPACSKPRHLFVNSDYPTGNAMCAHCWHMKVYFSSYHVDLIVYDYINTENFPILKYEGEDTCEVCGHPAFGDTENGIWQFRQAYLSGAETQVVAHIACSSESQCHNCDTIYANTRNRVRDSRDATTVGLYLIETYCSVEGNTYCKKCADNYMEENGGSDDWFSCPACSDYTHVDNSQWWENESYCYRCYADNVFECGNCGVERWSGDDHECDEEDELIHSYSYRPSPFFYGKGKYHFGFELEVEARGNGRHAGANLVTSMLGARVYLKDDGSLSDGFEIVTHPHTLETYQQEFDWEVLDKLRREGYRSWNTSTCGLHVHVSRNAFGEGDPWEYPLPEGERSARILKRQAHELRFMKLVYDNQRQVERIAGRSNNSYATFGDKGNLVRKVKYGHQSNGRYSAINTENDSTIEIRVFKGSLRKERVLSAIEFVHASVEYTRSIKVTSKNHALSWLKFTGYVSANSEMYPNLVTIMSESFASDTDHHDEN